MDRKSIALFLVGGLIVALGLVFFVGPHASTSPDGLNRVAIDQGFAGAQTKHATQDSPLAGYGVKGVHDRQVSKGLAGVIGVAITFGIGMILFGLLRTIRARREPAATIARPGGP